MRPLALSSRPPPLCGNREFRADVPHRNRDHRAFGAVRLVHSSIFPTTSRTQEGRFSAERDWSSCNRRWSWAARAGALGGARCETNGRPRAQYAPEPSVPEPPVPYLAARSSRSSSRWPQLIAPSLPAFSVTLLHPLCTACVCVLDHRAFGAVRLVHSSIFPTTSRTQEVFVYGITDPTTYCNRTVNRRNYSPIVCTTCSLP